VGRQGFFSCRATISPNHLNGFIYGRASINIALKIAMILAGLRQVDIALGLGVDEPQMSRIVHGRLQATPEQRERIAGMLGVAVDAL
jgi:hypothetical protein